MPFFILCMMVSDNAMESYKPDLQEYSPESTAYFSEQEHDHIIRLMGNIKAYKINCSDEPVELTRIQAYKLCASYPIVQSILDDTVGHDSFLELPLFSKHQFLQFIHLLEHPESKDIQNVHDLATIIDLANFFNCPATLKTAQELYANSLVLNLPKLAASKQLLSNVRIIPYDKQQEIRDLLAQNTARLYGTIATDYIQSLQEQNHFIYTLAIADGKLFSSTAGGNLFAGGKNFAINIWDLAENYCLQTEHVQARISAFALDQSKLFTGSKNSIMIWDLLNGYNIKTLETTGHVRALAIASDKLISAIGDTNPKIQIWDLITGDCTQTIEHADIITALTPMGDTFISGASNGTIGVWDLHTCQCLKTLEGHTESISGLTIDSGILLSCSNNGVIKKWDLQTGTCLQTLQGYALGISTTLTADKFFAALADGSIRVWDIAAYDLLQELSLEQIVTVLGLQHMQLYTTIPSNLQKIVNTLPMSIQQALMPVRQQELLQKLAEVAVFNSIRTGVLDSATFDKAFHKALQLASIPKSYLCNQLSNSLKK